MPNQPQGNGRRGRHEDDRSYSSPNQAYPGSFEDRQHDRGLDDRFTGRGGAGYAERPSGEDRRPAGWRGGEGDRIASPGGYGYNDGDSPNRSERERDATTHDKRQQRS